MEKHKKCRQCHRLLSEENFRSVASRSKGIRKRATGSRSICKACESANVRAYQFVVKMEAGEPVDEAKVEELRSYYRALEKAGYGVANSSARKLLGMSGAVAPQRMDKSLNELYEHIYKLKTRAYKDADEADEVNNSLLDRLREAGLYEEAMNLVDDWWLEG